MLISDKENGKKYLVYGVSGNMFITYESDEHPLNLLFQDEVKILDDTPSKYWIKYADNTYLPEGWNDENYLYELVDDLNPISNKKFKDAKEKIDKEFAYYFVNDNEKYQDPNIKITAEPIGDNWVLCPECNEAFEVDKEQGVITCPNVACRTKMNNPYAPIRPVNHENPTN